MKKTMIAVALCACALGLTVDAYAAPRAKKNDSQNHVPEKLDESIRPFYPKAAKRPHVVLVNVDNAIPPDIWPLATTYAVSHLQFNVWTNSINGSVLDKLIENPRCTPSVVGNTNSLIGVYFERRKGGCAILAAPACWSVINVTPYLESAKDPQQIRDRYAKLVMKGIATACGGGNTLEPFCSMFYGAQTPAGMDKANIAITPMCYFPMLETLRMVGGPSMSSACINNNEEE